MEEETLEDKVNSLRKQFTDNLKVEEERYNKLRDALVETLGVLYHECLDDAACDTENSLKIWELKESLTHSGTPVDFSKTFL